MTKSRNESLYAVERSLLGALIRYADARAACLPIIPSHVYFIDFANQQIYRALLELLGEGFEPELTLLARRLHAAEVLREIGGAEYLATVWEEATCTNHLEYARQVVGNYVRRQALEELERIKSAVSHPGRPLFQVLNESSRALSALTLPLLADTEREETLTMSYRAFPIDSLPKCLEELVTETAESIRVDPGALSVPLFVTLGAVIGANRVIQLAPGWYEQAIFWGMLVGDPTAKKTTSIRRIAAPLWDIEMELAGSTTDKIQEWQLDFKEWEERGAGLKGDAAKAHLLAAPERPCSRSFVVDDITLESLYRDLEDNPRGLICLQNEMTAWLKSMARYTNAGSSGERAKWLELFDGGRGKISRKGAGREPIHIANKHVSLLGGIQPGTLARAIGQEQFDDGMMARFLFCFPPVRVGELTEKGVDERITTAWSELCREIFFDDVAEQNGRSYKPKIVAFTSAGWRAWKSFFDDQEKQIATSAGELQHTLKRLQTYCGKIALVLAVVEKYWGQTRNLVIQESHVLNASRIVDWFGNEATRVFRMMKGRPDQRKKEGLLELIKRHGGQCSPRQLMRSNPAGYPDSETAENALDTLAKEGRGRWERKPSSDKGGAPTKVLVLH